MGSWLPEKLLNQIGLILGPIVGFVSAWILFELTERRKRRLAQRAMRNTVTAELRQGELILSNMVITFSLGAQDVARGVQEIHWFLDHGITRARFTGLEPTAEQVEQLEHFRNVPKEQVAMILQQRPAEQTSHALEVHLPILDAVLATPASGFGDIETQALTSVRWQLHMLSEEARTMADMLRFTFTVEDPDNHAKVVANLRAAREGYRKRAGVALDTVRTALRMLNA